MFRRLLPVYLVHQVYGGELTGNTGQLSSPVYPGNYPHNAHYIWTITVDVGRRVSVTFNVMDIEDSSSGRCIYDYVRVSPFFIRTLYLWLR